MAHGSFDFTGSGPGYLGSSIVNFLLIGLTAGLYTPWAIVNEQQWVAKHTRVEGKALTFRGTGAGLFGVWLRSAFLSVITLGIYYPWAKCRIQRWKTSNLYFADAGDIEQV